MSILIRNLNKIMLLFVLKMRGSARKNVVAGCLLFLTLCISSRAVGYPSVSVLVVLSSDSPIYQDALAGFKETCKAPIQTQILGGSLGPLAESSKIVVSFGRRAAEKTFPTSTTRIYCLDPGLVVGQGSPGGRQIV